MLKELINLVDTHKCDHPELYEYLMLTWTSCHYDSSLYVCNITGSTILQRHLSEFDEQDWRLCNKEKHKNL